MIDTSLVVKNEMAVLEAGITVAERQAIEAGRERSLTEKQNAIAAAEAAVDSAKQQVDTIQTQIDMIDKMAVDIIVDDFIIISLHQQLAEATGILNGAEENLIRVNTKMRAEVSLASLYKQILELRETIVGLKKMPSMQRSRLRLPVL